MQIDQVKKPSTFYYEAKTGEVIPYEHTEEFPELKWYAQHSKGVVVSHSLCFGNAYAKDAWIVRALKWLLEKCPDSWHKPQTSVSFDSGIGCGWNVIKYLVDKRDWSFNEACVFYSECCERCWNWLEFEAEGKDPWKEDRVYFENKHSTHCCHCKEVDPEYNYKYAIWRLYRTLNKKYDMKEAWADVKGYLL